MKEMHSWILTEAPDQNDGYYDECCLMEDVYDALDAHTPMNVLSCDQSSIVFEDLSPRIMKKFLKQLPERFRKRIQVLYRDEKRAFWREYNEDK